MGTPKRKAGRKPSPFGRSIRVYVPILLREEFRAWLKSRITGQKWVSMDNGVYFMGADGMYCYEDGEVKRLDKPIPPKVD